MFGSTCLKFGRLKAYKTASPAQRETYLNLTFTIQLQSTDPVYMTSLINFLKSKMAESHAVLGDPRFHSLMQTMDPVVAKQLMSLIS